MLIVDIVLKIISMYIVAFLSVLDQFIYLNKQKTINDNIGLKNYFH